MERKQIEVGNREWMPYAKCRYMDPEIFFPSDGAGVVAAKNICADCPAKSPCLEYALNNRIEHGVWGQTSERERRKIAKSRRNLGNRVLRLN